MNFDVLLYIQYFFSVDSLITARLVYKSRTIKMGVRLGLLVEQFYISMPTALERRRARPPPSHSHIEEQLLRGSLAPPPPPPPTTRSHGQEQLERGSLW